MSRLDDLARLMLAVLNDEQEPEDAPVKAPRRTRPKRAPSADEATERKKAG